ncbi:MAG: TonB family protein [Gemmatimonadaceae bacterium]|nr:TonB family protein [Gemmatimonadaceae bacterium]
MRARAALSSLLALFVAAGHAAGAQAPSISGRVTSPGGYAIAGVAIEVPSGTPRAHTDSAGEYRITGVPPGGAVLRARRLGYQPVEITVIVPVSGDVRADLRLVATVQHLEAIEVRDRADPSESRLSGFRDRATRRSGGGQFITRAQLDLRANTRLIEIVRELPGVTMRGPTRYADRSVRFRGASCPPLVFVDGFPATAGEFELDIIDLSTVEGIEIYPGLASVPAEFQATRGQHRCGVIAVWSRPPRVRRVARRSERPTQVATLVDAGRVYEASDVDVRAMLLADESPAPVYPDSHWNAGVGGEAIIEVIVDTLGRVEPASVSVVSETSPAFGAAAREAVRSSVFAPALKGGRRVRQVVHVPVAFGRQPGSD